MQMHIANMYEEIPMALSCSLKIQKLVSEPIFPCLRTPNGNDNVSFQRFSLQTC